MRIVCCLVMLLFIVSPAGAAPGAVSLVEPPDRSIVTGKLVPVVIALHGDADRVVITRNKEKVGEMPPRAGGYLCTTIEVGYGPVEIGVQAMKGERTVETKNISVYYESDISKKAGKAPPEFHITPFHTEARERVCMPCHNMEAPDGDAKPGKPELSSCYRCHRRITSYSYPHGPAAVWNCFVCHDRHSSPSKYATRQPDSVICFSCHSDSRARWATKEYVHGPTATGKCTICHDPHASDSQFFLRKTTWNLCVSCHEDRGKAHLFNFFALLNIDHRTRGVADPSRPGQMLSCASCHTPHASNASKFLVFEGDLIYDFCNKCHKK